VAILNPERGLYDRNAGAWGLRTPPANIAPGVVYIKNDQNSLWYPAKKDKI